MGLARVSPIGLNEPQVSSPPRTAGERDHTVDILRGIAIFTMVAANLASDVLIEPHPFLLRVYGTFAAPLFIMLAGMMVAQTQEKGRRSFPSYVLRGGLIVLVASLMDLVIWQDCPLVSFDVLY